ncbi:ATS1 [Candida metapsilosis]|uniref:ATS1 n=1 Tax=Candida metapsilosis TaxID=273372 RepID=A0A8H7ZGU3_9ASCO|nr:ATS1 [Candida metapsilosis]
MYQVLACGSNGNYQLGQADDEDQRALRPCIFQMQGESTTTTTTERKPIKVACGGNHTLILFDNGEVFSCGDNEFGQAGHSEDVSSVPVFTRIPPVQGKIIDISCGWDYSFLLTDRNELYVCGRGLKGELGLGSDISQAVRPRLVTKFDTKVKRIRTAVNHTIVQTDDNKLYGWGSCRKGQLGTVKDDFVKRGAIWKPVELDFGVPNIDSFELGREFTIVSSSRGVHLFGKSNIDIQKVREQVGSIELMETMWSSVHLKDHCTIKSFGTNTHGQLYNYGSIDDDFEFVVGSEHGLLKSENKVYAWGWGEHGNCGDSSDSITFDYLNLLYDGSNEVVMIFGGCATSWVVTKKRPI